MKIVIGLVVAALIVGAGTEFYLLFKERSRLEGEVGGLTSRLQALVAENATLKADIEYYSHPENLEKELRQKFNYKRSDEKMIIVVPQ